MFQTIINFYDVFSNDIPGEYFNIKNDNSENYFSTNPRDYLKFI